jgi:hypothetical protein
MVGKSNHTVHVEEKNTLFVEFNRKKNMMTTLFYIACIIEFAILMYAIAKGFQICLTDGTKSQIIGEKWFLV